MADRLESAGVTVAMALCNALPARWAHRGGRGLGRLAFSAGIRRRVCLGNLERAFGATLTPRARLDLARATYAHLGESFVEFLRLARADRKDAASRLDLEGEEHLRAALGAGRGAIVASGHLGNWEIMGAALADRGFPVTFVVAPLQNARVEAQVLRLRQGVGIDVLPRGMALRRVREALAANRLVFFMCDQDARRRGVFVPFFGHPASTPKGAAQFAIRLGVPFLPAFGWRVTEGRHRSVIGAPLAVPAGLDEERAVLALLRAFNALLEEAIRAVPAQYWWSHRRWKTVPPQAPGPASARPSSLRV